MKTLVGGQIMEVTWKCWNTYVSMDVLGLNGLMRMQMVQVTRKCCDTK